jgi:hypothetical protein
LYLSICLSFVVGQPQRYLGQSKVSYAIIGRGQFGARGGKGGEKKRDPEKKKERKQLVSRRVVSGRWLMREAAKEEMKRDRVLRRSGRKKTICEEKIAFKYEV